jgi:hypothetical protein
VVGRSRIPVLTQEFVVTAIIAIAVVSLLLLHYSTTQTSSVTVKCQLTNRKDLSARSASVIRSYLNSSARNCILATSLPRNRLSAPCSRRSSNRRHRRNRRIACRLLHDRRNGSGSKSEQRILCRGCTRCRNKGEWQREAVEQTSGT